MTLTKMYYSCIKIHCNYKQFNYIYIIFYVTYKTITNLKNKNNTFVISYKENGFLTTIIVVTR